MQELRISFAPLCHHTFGPLSCSKMLSNIWVSMVRVLWKDYGVIQEQLCDGDGGVTIRPLVELLEGFPRLKKFELDVVRGCTLPYSVHLVGENCFGVLRRRNVEMPFLDYNLEIPRL